MQSQHWIEQASTCAVCRYFHYLVSFCLVRNMERILYGPGDKHISCARRWACFVNALILFDCTAVCLVACLFDNCRRAFKMPVNGYVRCWVHFLSPPELSLSALNTVASQSTITGNNASNEMKLFARECYVVSRFPVLQPVRLSSFCYFLPSQT